MNSTNNGASSGTNFYAAGRLYKTVVKDENWVATSGKGGTVEEYKDFEGRVVLKRVWESNTKALNTYYIYDDFGDLCYVVPPGYAAVTITDNNADFNELLYAYKYDGRRRLVEKKVPGKGWEYLVYNKNDQPILTQDAVQREGKKWSYAKYDAFGRVASTGIYTNTTANQSTRAQVQALADAVPAQWESRSGAAYTAVTFPSAAAQLSERTVNYYDDYAFSGAAGLPKSGITESQQVRTLLTGTKVSGEDGTNALLTVHYYDARGRLLQSASQNHLGGTDYVTNSYNFPGELLSSKHEHRATPTGAVTTVLTTNTYDHVGRLKDTRKKVNSQAEILQSRLVYNEIGQLKTRGLHSENNGTNFLSTVAYSYNERGWTARLASGQFTEELKYELPGTGGTAQYNGNISQQLWGHAATTSSTFSYTYDGLNRLRNGTSTGTAMAEALTYDDMGNIKTLKRDGDAVVTYTYNNTGKSNRLLSLSGNTNNYTYDANGNTTKDRLATTFTYNHLNLPKTVSRTGTSVTYLYDAQGAKLRKTATVGGTTTQRDYIGGIEYSKTGAGASTIERIATETGYLQNASGTYIPHYTLTDHLGNVRSVLKRGASATTADVVQKQDYYAFGKTKSILTSGINRYLYNGKEVQEELGEQLDYGARFYDPVIGRWKTIDPMAEKYSSLSPYNYTLNNPLLYIDPDGRDVVISGALSEAALKQLQEGVKSTIKLSMDANGKVGYSINEGQKLKGVAKRMAGMIDDNSVTVNIITTDGNETSTGNLMIGGAFMGNTVTKDANGNTKVIAYQEVNPSVLNTADTHTKTPGKMMMHETTEAYQGAQISKKAGVGVGPATQDDASNPQSIYNRAHNSATSQSPVHQTLYDKNGNVTTNVSQAARIEWKVISRGKSKVIQTYP